MRSKKLSILVISVGLIIVLTLSGCGSGQPASDPAVNLATAAQQTVAVILTSTAQARRITEAAVQTDTAIPTTTPTLAPPTATPTYLPTAIRTPGQLYVEPTRNVVYETPSGKVVQEPGHEATVEPTK
jgi:hypothetical protein